jgi:hypothetical protein
MDLFLTVLSAAVQAVLAYLGFHLSVKPPTPSEQRRYKVAFVSLGIVGVFINGGQQWRNSAEQSTLKEQLAELKTGIKTVERQTQQPPHVTVNVPQVPVQIVPGTTREAPRQGTPSALNPPKPSVTVSRGQIQKAPVHSPSI